MFQAAAPKQSNRRTQHLKSHIFTGDQLNLKVYNVHRDYRLGQQLCRELERVITIQKETGTSGRMMYEMARNAFYSY